MRRRIRELVALMLAVCMICGGIWIGKSAAYAAEVGTVYTLMWMDRNLPDSDYTENYEVKTYDEYTIQISEGGEFSIPENPTKPGYAFIGWNGYDGGLNHPMEKKYKHDDGSLILDVIDNYTPQNNTLTMYASWQVFNYMISYDGNGAEAGVPTEIHGETDSIYYLDEVLLSETIPSRSGYTFNGWEYDGTVYPAGETFIVPDAPYQTVEGDYEIYMAYITLTASWTPNQHTITYDGNGAASGVPAAQQAGYETTVTAGAAPVREGYTFTGWLSSTGETYPAGGTFTMPDSDVTLTAQWEVANTGGISSAGSYYLLRGQPYSLNGVTKTERDEGVYAGGITFYVPSDGYYTFTE